METKMIGSHGPCHKKPGGAIKMMKTPIRAISKALNLYVKGVNNFATTYNSPLRTLETTVDSQHQHQQQQQQQQQLPRSFSVSRLPDRDQPPESALVRSISSRTANVTEMKSYKIQNHRSQFAPYASSRMGMPRSCSVGMGRIDEDRASSFKNIDVHVKDNLVNDEKDSMLARSRTYNQASRR